MIRITLASEDDIPSSILVLNNVLYIPQCPVNLVSLGLLNQHKVYFDKLNWNLFLLSTRDIIGYAPRVNTNFMLKTLHTPDLAIHLTRIEADIFQWPETAIYHTSSKVKLTTWHARLGHLNISSCRKYLKGLDVSFLDDIKDDWYCSSCELGKATKQYNRSTQKTTEELFQKVHSELVGPIHPTIPQDPSMNPEFAGSSSKVRTKTYTIKIVDSYNILPHSLKKLCETYNTEVIKDIFPYDFININTLFQPRAAFYIFPCKVEQFYLRLDPSLHC